MNDAASFPTPVDPIPAHGLSDVVAPADAARRQIRDYWHRRSETFGKGQWNPNKDDDSRSQWSAVYREALTPAHRRVLDVGCGPGEVVFLLRALGHDAEGADFAPGMLAIAKASAAERSPEARFTEANAARLPFPDGAFDAVHARLVLWTQPDRDKTLQEWMRVLRPGGRLVIVEGTWFPPSLADRVRRTVGRAMQRASSWFTGAEVPRSRFLPFHIEVSQGMYPGLDVLPNLWGYQPDQLGTALKRGGLLEVRSRALTELQAWARSRAPLHQKIHGNVLQGACIAWGDRSVVAGAEGPR